MRNIVIGNLKPLQNVSKNSSMVKFHVFSLNVTTHKAPEFIDITESIRKCLADSMVNNGTLNVYSCHTTAAIKINENEPLLLQDMERFLERAAPRNDHYMHNDFNVRTVNMTEDECPNGHAHCQQLLLGTSESIPIINGTLAMGKWQSIFMVELDRPRSREILVQIMGA